MHSPMTYMIYSFQMLEDITIYIYTYMWYAMDVCADTDERKKMLFLKI